MWTLSDLGWLSWFVQTHSRRKKNGVSVSDAEDDSVDLNDDRERKLFESSIAPTPFFPRKYYFFFNTLLNKVEPLYNKAATTTQQ